MKWHYTTMSKEDRNLRAVGELAAMKYLAGRKPKSEPITLLKCPAQYPMSLIFRLFSKWGNVTLPPL
jgi:hypothetical protein